MLSWTCTPTYVRFSILLLSIFSISGTTPKDYFRNAVVSAIKMAYSKVNEEKTLNRELFEAGIDENKQTANHRHMLGIFRLLMKKSSPDSSKASILLTATQELSKSLGLSVEELQRNPVIREAWWASTAQFCRVKRTKCKPSLYRSADGSCNNLDLPELGRSNRGQTRYLPPDYSDGISAPRMFSVTGKQLPSPRHISNVLHRTAQTGLREPLNSAMLMQWGQLLDHDILDTPTMKGHENADISCCNLNKDILLKRSGCFSINIPAKDPYFSKTCMNFVRSAPAVSDTCNLGHREQLNQATSYIDASYLYGSDLESTSKMRSLDRGFLKMDKYRLFMPSEEKDQCVKVAKQDYCMKSGDRRIHVVPGLASTQILMLREHNRVANILGKLNPHWNDETTFQQTRKIIAALNQHITYTEYLPKILGPAHMLKYGLRVTRRAHNTIYDPTYDATIRNVFGAAAFRFGHAQIPPNVDFLYKSGQRKSVKLEDTYNKPSLVIEDQGQGVDRINRALIQDPSGLTDRFLETGVADKLFLDMEGESFDLASLNIQRGRDHGIAGYNAWRKWCGLPPAIHFRSSPGGLVDISPETGRLLSQVYSHPEDIDLYTGGLSEGHVPGGEVGPTFACIIARQFKDSKYGDRFWYENKLGATGFTRRQLIEIKKMRLSNIMCNNMDDEAIQRDVFQIPSKRNPKIPCRLLGDINYRLWKEVIPSSFKRFPAPPFTVISPLKYWIA